MRVIDKILSIFIVVGMIIVAVGGGIYVFDGLFKDEPYYVNITATHVAFVGLVLIIASTVIKLIALGIKYIIIGDDF